MICNMYLLRKLFGLYPRLGRERRERISTEISGVGARSEGAPVSCPTTSAETVSTASADLAIV